MSFHTIKLINAGMFPVSCLVGFGCTKATFIKHLKQVTDTVHHQQLIDDAFCVDKPTNAGIFFGLLHQTFIWIPSGEVDILIHELVHLSTHVLEHCGVPMSKENDEVLAYLMGDFVSQLQK